MDWLKLDVNTLISINYYCSLQAFGMEWFASCQYSKIPIQWAYMVNGIYGLYVGKEDKPPTMKYAGAVRKFA